MMAVTAVIFMGIQWKAAAPGQWARHYLDTTSLGKIGFRLYLPQKFGYVGALLLTLAALFLLYLWIVAYENWRKQQGTYLDPREKKLYGIYHKLFIERWSFNKGALVLSLAAIFVMVTPGKAWGMSTPLVDLGLKFSISWVEKHRRFLLINSARKWGKAC